MFNTQQPLRTLLTLKIAIRGKRTLARDTPPHIQRIISQLSVFSARKKLPKVLKLSREDLIRHQTIQRAWYAFQTIEVSHRQLQLKRQYKSINEAMDKLSNLDNKLFERANVDEIGNLFPIDMRFPTDFPARKVWQDEYTEPVEKK